MENDRTTTPGRARVPARREDVVQPRVDLRPPLGTHPATTDREDAIAPLLGRQRPIRKFRSLALPLPPFEDEDDGEDEYEP